MPGINLIFKVTGANVSSATGVTTPTARPSSLTLVRPLLRPGSSQRRQRRHERRLESAERDLGPAHRPPPSISVGAYTSVTLPSPLLLSATVTDPPLLRADPSPCSGAR